MATMMLMPIIFNVYSIIVVIFLAANFDSTTFHPGRPHQLGCFSIDYTIALWENTSLTLKKIYLFINCYDIPM